MGYLDVIYEHLERELFLSSNLQKLLPDYSDDEQAALQTEIKCFELMLSKGELIPVFVWGDYKRTDIELLTPEEVMHIKERLATEIRPFLVARYTHILFVKSRNNQFAYKAINAYRCLATEYSPKLATKEKNNLDFIGVIEAYAHLSLAVKYNTEDCRKTIVKWYGQPDQHPFYYQCFLNLFAGSKLFKKEHLTGFTATAINYLGKIGSMHDAEDYLKACLCLAKKENIKLLPVYLLMAENHQKLAEQPIGTDSPMVATDHFLAAARHYKAAKELKKSNDMLRFADAQTKKISLSVVRTEMEGQELQDFVQSIQVIAKSYLKNSPETVFVPMAIDKRILPSTKNYEPDPRTSFLDMCRVSSFDINANTHILSEYDKQKQKVFMYYQIGLELTIPLLFTEIIKEMKSSERDFVQEGLIYFEGSWFAVELQKTTTSDFSIIYKWMPMLKPALNLLLESALSDNGEVLTWEQQMAFDQLAIKFEGLLRDLCAMANITITKVYETQTLSLDINELLKSQELIAVFEEKDLELWQFVFTRSGYNIRNNAAHAFYRPNNYTVRLSNILLTAYIRLAKYGDIVMKATDFKSEDDELDKIPDTI